MCANWIELDRNCARKVIKNLLAGRSSGCLCPRPAVNPSAPRPAEYMVSWGLKMNSESVLCLAVFMLSAAGGVCVRVCVCVCEVKNLPNVRCHAMQHVHTRVRAHAHLVVRRVSSRGILTRVLPPLHVHTTLTLAPSSPSHLHSHSRSQPLSHPRCRESVLVRLRRRRKPDCEA